MKVIRAEHAGACYGVQRALDIAEREVEAGARARSLGPLIHNPQVVEQLRERGLDVLEEVPDVFEGAIVVRSHGVGPETKRRLEACGCRIADATCPYVLRAQRAGEHLSRNLGFVLVVGEEGHPEVEAIRAYAEEAGGTVRVVSRAASLPEVLPDALGVVVQTTQNRAVFEEILLALQERGIRAEVKDTICAATSERQEAAALLASKVDAMVVIGGRNSSNTTRLFEICQASCPITYHVESAGELTGSMFEGCESVGVTAGASTPESQIAPVVEYLERV